MGCPSEFNMPRRSLSMQLCPFCSSAFHSNIADPLLIIELAELILSSARGHNGLAG